MAEFLLRLYDSDCTLGIVDRKTFKFELRSPKIRLYAAPLMEGRLFDHLLDVEDTANKIIV